jgi:hypothetical protein
MKRSGRSVVLLDTQLCKLEGSKQEGRKEEEKSEG